MSDDYESTWECYTSSWRAKTAAEKRSLYERCLDPACRYTDPLISTKGWDELAAYMLAFHEQVPGGHFETTWFVAHNRKSGARWNMLGGDGTLLGNGVSFGEYDEAGKLVAMTGFYETPGGGRKA